MKKKKLLMKIRENIKNTFLVQSYHTTETPQGYALTPDTYVASIDADAVSAKSFHESVDSMTKSASFPIDKDPKSLSMKLARAAEMVYLLG
jgi:hypothetical protein